MKKNDFSAAITALKNGEPIIFPTDTLYALGADIYNETAVQKIYDMKQRPLSIPLPVAVESIQAIETIAYMNEAAHKLSTIFLPGTLTIILEKKPTVPLIVTSGSPTIAVRVPNDPIALKLLSTYGPLTVTSANIHHKKTQSLIQDILIQLQASKTVYLDDGRRNSTSSTIVDLTAKKPHVIRAGSISEKEILEVMSHE
jgi:L-threonylcarbamoyladenylate synthase